MITQTKKYLPLKIKEASWNKAAFHMGSDDWGFYTLGGWRIVTDKKVVFGCFDDIADEISKYLIDIEIVRIDIQESILKIDPVFVLSNGEKIEIFSTDTYEAWSFRLDEKTLYDATPHDPEIFIASLSKLEDSF